MDQAECSEKDAVLLQPIPHVRDGVQVLTAHCPIYEQQESCRYNLPQGTAPGRTGRLERAPDFAC